MLGTYSVPPSCCNAPRDIDKKIPGQIDDQLPGILYLAVLILT